MFPAGMALRPVIGRLVIGPLVIALCGAQPDGAEPRGELGASRTKNTTPLSSEERLWSDLRDGTLDTHDLWQAALIAGGCTDPATIARHEGGLADLVRRRAEGLAACAEPAEQAERLLELMHERLAASQFNEYAYRVDQTLAGDAHNCLTTTILFLCLCREANIDAVAVATPTHMFCRVRGSREVDIQPLQPTRRENMVGLPLAEDPLSGVAHASANLRGTSCEPARKSSGSCELSDAGVLARVYYNRGTRLLWLHEPERAARCLQQSRDLDPASEPTHYNLRAAWNAWALQLSGRAQYREALGVLERCWREAPDDLVTRQNDLHIRHRWVMELCQQQQFAAALEVLEDGRSRQPQASLFTRGPESVIRWWAREQLEQGHRNAAGESDAMTLLRRAPAIHLTYPDP